MPGTTQSRRAAGLIALHLIGAASGFGLYTVGAPLAWMIGPMLSTAAASSLPQFRAPPLALRWGGQLIVASAVALTLSPEALRVIADDAFVMLGSAVVSVVVAILMARSMARAGLLDPTTSLLALLPGGPAEMATLAAKHGGKADLVALAQTFRLSLTVFTVPFLLLAIAPLTDAGALSAAPATSVSAIVALAAAVPVALGLHRFGFANAFFVAPLIAVGALALAGLAHGPLPFSLVATGQILIGVSLGAMLSPRALAGMGRDLRLALMFSVALVLLGLGLATALSGLGVSSFGEMVLANAAGGVAEMSIAAANFGFDPAYVSAYHLMRIFLIVPLAEQMLRFVV